MSDLETALSIARAKRRLPSPPARRLLRQRALLTQEDIAQAVGCHRVEVTRWESGARNPGPRFLQSYLAVLDRLAAEATRDV